MLLLRRKSSRTGEQHDSFMQTASPGVIIQRWNIQPEEYLRLMKMNKEAMKQSKSNKSNEVITFYIVILSLSYSLHFSTGITCNSTRLLFQSSTYIIQFLYIYNCISKAHSLQFHHHACAGFHYGFPLNCTAIGYQKGYYWSLSTTIQCTRELPITPLTISTGIMVQISLVQN